MAAVPKAKRRPVQGDEMHTDIDAVFTAAAHSPRRSPMPAGVGTMRTTSRASPGENLLAASEGGGILPEVVRKHITPIASSVVVVGVDPDASGALCVLRMPPSEAFDARANRKGSAAAGGGSAGQEVRASALAFARACAPCAGRLARPRARVLTPRRASPPPPLRSSRPLTRRRWQRRRPRPRCPPRRTTRSATCTTAH